MKKVLLWIGAVLFCIVAGIASCGALFELLKVEEELTETDHALLLTTMDLAPWFEGWDGDESAATRSKTRYPDGSRELLYANDATAVGGPYVDLTIGWENSPSDAAMVLQAIWIGVTLGLGAEGDSIEEVEPPPDLGDDCRMVLLRNEAGELYGSVVGVRAGSAYYFVLLVSYLIDDPTDWENLLERRIRLLAAP